MAKKISDLPVGARVKDIQSKYLDQPIIWIVAAKNHTGYPEQSVTLITEKIIALKAFDANEPNNSDTRRRDYGNNRYRYANINKWLNSEGRWYSAQHSQDSAPTAATVSANEYENEQGFLTGFSRNFKNSIKETDLTVLKHFVDGSGKETISAKVFLASKTEVGLYDEMGIAEGSKLALFTDDNSRRAYPTAAAVGNSNYKSSKIATNKICEWWLRTPLIREQCAVWSVHGVGGETNQIARLGINGIRPLCNVKSSILVSDSTDSDGAYSIIFNRPPRKPSAIDVPDTIKGGSTAQISWAASSDDDNNLAGYILEKQVDNAGGYSPIYKGASRKYVDNIQSGLNSVRYRVKAYDTANAMSEYETSPLKTVINNTPPTISGSNENLGEKTGPFSKGYTVTDVDAGQQLTVVETIDGKQKRSYTAESGRSQTFDVTLNEWREMLNGAHEMKVNASDGMGGSVERVYNFTKSEKEVELTLSSPLPADDIITKAIISITGEIPLGATMEVFVCNNGNDPSPNWEDVSSTVKAGGKIFFANKTKTAENWGFNIKVKVKRNEAVGEVYIAGIGGNFE